MRRYRVILTATVIAGTVVTGPPLARAQLPGASARLTRAPYLTDVTTTSTRVTWAASTSGPGTVRYGPPGACTTHTISAPSVPITVNGVAEFQTSVAMTGLAGGQPYCYRIFAGGPPEVDLLGTNASPQFTTVSPATSTRSFSFLVVGDLGDTTTASGANNGGLNTNQAAVDALIAASGARFAISTGDIAYQAGSQTNYGDLNQTGPNVSAMFAPAYWAVPGQRLPLFTASGNHGRVSTFLSMWPQATVTASSTGSYAMQAYPSIDGSLPASYPTSFFAFSTGGVRFYVLDAAWSTGNIGTATGGACGALCAVYQLDRDAHWLTSSAQYQWLARDLAAHPGGIKLAFFHFPLRSDNATEAADAFLQNTPDNPDSLEKLLRDAGVRLVFNGHAHTYQRFVAPPTGVASYVSGGGGARLEPVSQCSTLDAYAIGWSYNPPVGSACGAAPKPTSIAAVFGFLKVTVRGSTLTVTPINALGQAFDEVSYPFAPDTSPPAAPAALTLTRTGPSGARLTWSPATDNLGVSAYDVYRDGTWIATTPPAVLRYSDTTVPAGRSCRYEVRARDFAGNTKAVGAVLPASAKTRRRRR